MGELRDSDIYTSNNRAEESAYAQSRLVEQKPVGELNRGEVAAEYSRLLVDLPEKMRTAMREMKLMRADGIPDRAAYAKIRDEITREYYRFRAISQRMVDYPEELEDAYTMALQADAKGAPEGKEPAKVPGEQPPEVYVEQPAKVSAELYDEEVRKLLYVAAELEENVQSFAKQGMLEKLRPTIKKEQQGILDKLKELDKDSTVKYQSRERESLIDVLSRIDELLEQPAAASVPAGPSGDSGASFAMALEDHEEAYTSSLERYDEEVRKLLAEAEQLEGFVEFYSRENILKKMLPPIRETMATILVKLKRADDQKTDATPSRERQSLIHMLSKIDERLEAVDQGASATPLSQSRAAYRTLRAQYATVQHTLAEDQRRAMRMSIARMSDAVRQAEDEAWSGMFDRQFEPVPPPEPPEQSAIRSAVAHATEHAPELATAALASMPTAIATPHITESRGFFGAIFAAFKLR